MKLGVLFSGGKDSTLALQKASQFEDVYCLITVASKNPESYMFHTPNILVTKLQSEALDIPQVLVETDGVKEKELADLEAAITSAMREYKIDAVVTGAIESVYQAERVQRICARHGLWCFNPLWKCDQTMLLSELLEKKYKVIISGVFAYPFDETWLGREIDSEMIGELADLNRTHQISPSGEGGELETTVLDAPFFKKRINVLDSAKFFSGNSGTYHIKTARLEEK